jgi:pimeloyl-ACP methyl ester carboxylesterase
MALLLRQAIEECRQVYYTNKSSPGGIKYNIKDVNGLRVLIIKGTTPSAWREVRYSICYGLETVNGTEYHKGYVQAAHDLTQEIGIQKFDIVMGHSLGAAVALLYRELHNLRSTIIGFCPPKFCKSAVECENVLFLSTSWDPCSLSLGLYRLHFPSNILVRSPKGIPHLTFTIENTYSDLLDSNIQEIIDSLQMDGHDA